MDELLARLLGDPPQPASIADARGWWAGHAAARQALAPGTPGPLVAALGGFCADRLGWAFASGYVEALRTLVPSVAARPAALCVTEEGGGHPRAIRTTVARDGAGGWRLDGKKRFVTLADLAEDLLVAVTSGEGPDGRPLLRLVRVEAARAGVSLRPTPETPFVPEVAHAEVAFDGVLVGDDALLPGDGYDRYVKPFRTVEDIHVMAALCGHLVGVARRAAWPDAMVERLCAAVASLAALGGADPSARATHVALAGALATIDRIVDDSAGEWARVDAESRARWQRDRPLLQVAGRARAERRASAWRALRGEPVPSR